MGYHKNNIRMRKQLQGTPLIWTIFGLHFVFGQIGICHHKLLTIIINVATLALGSWLSQGVARLQAKREAWKSPHMLPRVQRMWGNEPSHSQMNSHCESWTPKWIPKSSKRDCKGLNPLVQIVLYIIGNLLKRRCLKWDPIMTRSQVTGWNPLEGSIKPSCGKLRLGGTLPASNSIKG
jgi:hypothetical protein